MTAAERSDYLQRCRQSGMDQEAADDFLIREMERRQMTPTETLVAAIRAAFRNATQKADHAHPHS